MNQRHEAAKIHANTRGSLYKSFEAADSPLRTSSSERPSTKQPRVTSSLSCRLLEAGFSRSVIVSL